MLRGCWLVECTSANCLLRQQSIFVQRKNQWATHNHLCWSGAPPPGLGGECCCHPGWNQSFPTGVLLHQSCCLLPPDSTSQMPVPAHLQYPGPHAVFDCPRAGHAQSLGGLWPGPEQQALFSASGLVLGHCSRHTPGCSWLHHVPCQRP